MRSDVCFLAHLTLIFCVLAVYANLYHFFFFPQYIDLLVELTCVEGRWTCTAYGTNVY